LSDTDPEDFDCAGFNEPDRGNPLTAELERSAPNHYREAATDALDFFKNCARTIKEFRGDRGFAFDCWLLALGWYEVLGVRDQATLAAKWSCKKANVSKLVKKFQGPGFLNLPPMPGQRSIQGCANMSTKRKGQLKK